MSSFSRLLATVGHALWRPLLRRRLGRLVIERLEGLSFVVLPQVFNPAVFRSSGLLVRAFERLPAPGAEARALEMGSGSGVGAVFAARRGYRAWAVDLNPDAVSCTRINALIHGLGDRIEARHGDLFAPVAGQRFDLVLFNPPFFRGEPRSPLDAAWRGHDVLERFAAGLAGHLAPGGRALVVLSSDGDPAALLDTLPRHGLRGRRIARRRYATETLSVWELRGRGVGVDEPAVALSREHAG